MVQLRVEGMGGLTSGGQCPARDEAISLQALPLSWLCLFNRDLKLCDEQGCTSSSQSCVSLPDQSQAEDSCRVEQHAWEDTLLPSSQQQSAARARVTISSASRLLMSYLAVLVSPNSELFLEVLRSLLSGSGLYPVIAWRDRGSGFCSCVWAPKQSPSFGPGDVRSWQPFWHPSQDLWHFRKILSEIFE